MNEIIGKLRDSLAMFWESLDARERMMMVYVGVYGGFIVLSYLSALGKAGERKRLVNDVADELEARRVR